MSSGMLEPLKSSASVPACTVDHVVAVARIPLEAVVAEPRVDPVGADVPVDVVVAGPAEQYLGAVAAEQGCRRRRRLPRVISLSLWRRRRARRLMAVVAAAGPSRRCP